MGNSSSKKSKAKATAKAKQTTMINNIAGGCAAISGLLIIIALAVNELVVYSVITEVFLDLFDTTIKTTASTRYGWDGWEVCTVNEQIDKYGSEKIDERCVDN